MTRQSAGGLATTETVSTVPVLSNVAPQTQTYGKQTGAPSLRAIAIHIRDESSSLVPSDERGGMPRNEVQPPQLDGLYPSGQVKLTARSIAEHSQAVRPMHILCSVGSARWTDAKTAIRPL
jgi:hypothetical protein